MSTTAAGSPETFRWHVGAGMPAYATLAGVRFDRLFLDADAIIDAYRRGQPLARELFGPDVTLGGPLWLGNSYGHINTLGSQLVFPPDSEVGHTPVYGSLEEGIRALGREVDFSRAGLIPRYFELRATLQKAFPQENIPFALHAEGPITTAWLLRGHDFFADLLEAPDEAREYLRRVTESVISFNRFCQRVNGNPELSPTGAGVADDGSAMISPAHWPDLVVPYLERYYSELTTGSRWAHIEDLKIGHLPFLDQLRLNRFDPSVSPALTPAAIRDHCRVPFAWRLNSTHYPALTPAGVERWVFAAAADGAAEVFTYVAREMCNPLHATKLHAFIRAAKQVQDLLAHGCPRAELRRE